MSFLLTQHNGPSPDSHSQENIKHNPAIQAAHVMRHTQSDFSFSFSDLLLRFLYGFRVQAPCCARCRTPILPTEVSYSQTEMHIFLHFFVLFAVNGKGEKRHDEVITHICSGRTVYNIFPLFDNSCRGQQSLFEWYRSIKITMWSATAVRLTSFKENSRLTFIFLCFSTGLCF